jgi:TolB-like protein
MPRACEEDSVGSRCLPCFSHLDANGRTDYRSRMLRPSTIARALATCVLLSTFSVLAAPGGDKAEHNATVAILYFDYAGHDLALEALKKGLAQMLISDLTTFEPVRIVEREQLQAVLDEQKLAQTGKTDAVTAARIGKLLGARYLVLGNYFDALGSFRVDARLVDVETGQVLKSIGANGKADDFLTLEQTLVEGLRQAIAKLPAGPSGPGGGRRSPPGASNRRTSPSLPRQLKTETALVYGRALVAMDEGDRTKARTLFRKVLSAQPDFELAQRDLNKLVQ